ncbi:MAG: DUF6591 domain-containing protein [Ruminococcus sp.]
MKNFAKYIARERNKCYNDSNKSYNQNSDRIEGGKIMSKKTKILCVLCTAVMITLCFVGCGNNADSKTQSSNVSTEETTNGDKSSSKDTNQVTTENSKNEDDGMGSDFKAAMDSYEEFMDEYVAFMKKYNDNPNDAALLADYADYTSKYSDFVKDFEKWESEDMNTAEAAYYLEVQTRVNKKLLEVE